VRIRYYRSARGDEPVREYIATLPTRERDDWDEALTLLGLFGLDAPVSLRQLDGNSGRFGWVVTAWRTSSFADRRWCCCMPSRNRDSERLAASSILPRDGRGKFWEGSDEEAEGSQPAPRP
jgi:hypothetical protein